MRRDVRILLVGDGVCLSRRDVSQWVLRLLLLAPRGCREEHHSHLAHQGILRSACTSVYLTRAHSTLTWRGRPPQFSRSVLHPPAVQVQHIVPEVTIPPEVTPENVTTYIVDSGSACLALSLCMLPLFSCIEPCQICCCLVRHLRLGRRRLRLSGSRRMARMSSAHRRVLS